MDTLTSKPWPLPREGAYLISFKASRFPGALVDVESAEGLAAMVDNIRHVSEHTKLNKLAVYPTAFRNGGLFFSDLNISREESSTSQPVPTFGLRYCSPKANNTVKTSYLHRYTINSLLITALHL